VGLGHRSLSIIDLPNAGSQWGSDRLDLQRERLVLARDPVGPPGHTTDGPLRY